MVGVKFKKHFYPNHYNAPMQVYLNRSITFIVIKIRV
jgi:hypothetical protein